MVVSFYPILPTPKPQYPSGLPSFPPLPPKLTKFNVHRNLKNITPERIGSSRLDCGNKVRHPLCLVLRRGETRTGEIHFGTLNVCGGMDDKIDDVCELMKDRANGDVAVLASSYQKDYLDV
ncbi:hypothetical protein EVAR_78150_1 [Eumeta japonica]|uniref:Uncharacterized protein n=1 Tax=Eumeta variegata TaxID=151549 RepID=A0A4C1UYK0_EUMVA|nr:hypothetical protein EVAR_78150_1 [Eumeta japonica]